MNNKSRTLTSHPARSGVLNPAAARNKVLPNRSPDASSGRGILKVRDKLWGILVFCILLSSFSVALENPEQKVMETIKDYVVTKYPNISKEEINVVFKMAEKTFAELKKAEKDGEFKIAEVYPDFKPIGKVIFPMEVILGQQEKRVFIRANVEIRKYVAAAAKLIKKGKIIDASDITFEVRDVAVMPQSYFVDYYSLINKESKVSIPKNSTIFEWMVSTPPLIRNGSEVSVIISADGLVVKARAVVLEDGYPNSDIKVKPKTSNKIISAKVLSANEVEVKL